MHIIGLTGGIATGKSTASSYLAKQDIPIIDCDKIAHQVVEIGKPALEEITQSFGNDVINQDGSLNRQKMGEIIFNSQQRRKVLEEIIHSKVLSEVQVQLQTYREKNTPIVVVDIPLLFEANLEYLVDEVWVVACGHEQQITRLKKRNGLSREQAEKRINTQMPLLEKQKRADLVLDNSNTYAYLKTQINNRLQQIKTQMR